MNKYSYVIGGGGLKMKKTYKIEVDCANCANLMEEAAKKTPGVKECAVSFMTLKMKVEFDDGADVDTVMKNVRANCKKVEDDCEIYL
jgi:copper chaperone CopZ